MSAANAVLILFSVTPNNIDSGSQRSNRDKGFHVNRCSRMGRHVLIYAFKEHLAVLCSFQLPLGLISKLIYSSFYFDTLLFHFALAELTGCSFLDSECRLHGQCIQAGLVIEDICGL